MKLRFERSRAYEVNILLDFILTEDSGTFSTDIEVLASLISRPSILITEFSMPSIPEISISAYSTACFDVIMPFMLPFELLSAWTKDGVSSVDMLVFLSAYILAVLMIILP